MRDIVINRSYRKQLKNRSFSLITSDCTGGVMCKDLSVRMNSPTRNLFFNASDFICFCENLDYYLTQKLQPTDNRDNSGYLTAKLGDLVLYLVHYDSFDQAKEEWERRKVRVNKENLFFIMNDRNGCTYSDVEAFDRLPYKNKVFFSHKPYPEFKSVVYIKGSERFDSLKTITAYVHQLGIKRYYDQFDFVTWLNSEND